jgi:hypothetical protein
MIHFIINFKDKDGDLVISEHIIFIFLNHSCVPGIFQNELQSKVNLFTWASVTLS